MPSYLITGATGFLGPNVAATLAEAFPAAQIWCLEMPGTRLPGVVAALPQIRCIGGDIADVEVPFSDGCVVHCAAVRDSTSPRLWEVNAVGTGVVAERAARRNCSFIYASTQSVYGVANELPAREEEQPQPDTEYGRSKLAGERAVEAAYGPGDGWVALRLSRLYGVAVGQRYDGAVGAFLGAARSGAEAVVRGDGSAVLDLLDIGDACSAVVAACRHVAELRGPYNVGSGEPLSVLEVAQLIREHRPGFAWRHEPIEDAGPGVWLDARRFRSATGWAPQLSPREGIARACHRLESTSGLGEGGTG
jgi:UDP-glucose 4-epimerase